MTNIFTPEDTTVGWSYRTRDSRICPKIMGICVERSPVGKSRDIWEDTVIRGVTVLPFRCTLVNGVLVQFHIHIQLTLKYAIYCISVTTAPLCKVCYYIVLLRLCTRRRCLMLLGVVWVDGVVVDGNWRSANDKWSVITAYCYVCIDVSNNSVLLRMYWCKQSLRVEVRGLMLCSVWVYGRSLAGIASSNSTGGMDVCLLWVLCVVT
jgi:hypothetical protein